ncbi:site-specific integrase [Burkholderia vietnamiensis]|uniref:site-specific integrase n=1 Tax=Burkholderia vietnamiensis TaxID=60552 RepID=UPI000AABFFB2|nr:site-specific integrase [Burkholderia vietnamiensis]
MSEHITKRGGRYYYRRRVPSDLVEKYGRKEHTQALGTSDKREAEIRARRAAVNLDAIFESLRRVYTGVPETKSGAWEPNFHPDELGDPEWNSQEEDARDARIEEMKSAVRSVLGEYGGYTPPQPQAAPLISDTSKQPEGGARNGLAVALRVWREQRSPDSSTVEKAELCAGRFHEACGRLSLDAIRPDHGKAFIQALVAKGLSHGTVSTAFGTLKAVLSAAASAGLVPVNPWTSVKVPAAPRKTANKSRVAFSPADVAVILDKLPASGHARWIPLIGLYTGMRLEEIGQLAPDDVREESYRDAGGNARKIHVIYVTAEGEGQGIKNSTSRRRVPVHSELVRLGFLDLVASAKGARVFSDLKPDRHGREAASFGATFGRTFLRKVCEISDTRKTFHSFRHLFKDVMREHGVPEDVSDALTGHTTGTVSRGYGGDFYPLRPLAEAIFRFEIVG